MTVRAGIALGSNLGDRPALLHTAIEHLRALAAPGEPVRVAPFYQTEPHCCPPGSPPFLNTVVEIGHAGSAADLLVKTRHIENQLGRLRGSTRNAPRTIDLDLLYHGDDVLADAGLTLPHPRLTERRFVLQPLADIRPDLVLPGQCRTVGELLACLPSGEPPLQRLA